MTKQKQEQMELPVSSLVRPSFYDEVGERKTVQAQEDGAKTVVVTDMTDNNVTKPFKIYVTNNSDQIPTNIEGDYIIFIIPPDTAVSQDSAQG